jgi:hypothetical protein
MQYFEKLKDPRWQKKRLKIFERDGWACNECAAKKFTLHVHHIEYTCCDPWDEPDKNLITLCENCHDLNHTIKLVEVEKYGDGYMPVDIRLCPYFISYLDINPCVSATGIYFCSGFYGINGTQVRCCGDF